MKKGELASSCEFPLLPQPVAIMQRPAAHLHHPVHGAQAIVPRTAAQLTSPANVIELTRIPPKELASSLSNIEDIEAELSPDSGNGDAQ